MFLNYQLEYLLWLQNIREVTSGFFDTFFLSLTYFGELYIPITFIALVYWCLNKKVGEFLLINYFFGLLFNQLFKMMICIDRPWILSDKIKPVKDALPGATGYSFPSGHTARAMTVWGSFAIWFWENKKIRYSMIFLILLIAFSRNYLGVHTPQDVVFSLLLGLIILFFTKKIFDNFEKKSGYDIKIFSIGIIVFVLSMVFIVFKYYHLNGDSFFSYANQLPSCYLNMGFVFGIFSGWFLCRKLIPFSTDNLSLKKRVLRFIFGYIGLLILMLCGVQTFTQDFGLYRASLIGSAITGIYISFLYPFVFTRIERKIELKNKDIQ